MTTEPRHEAGLSGDLGWNEADDAHTRGLSTALLLVASTVVWGSVWLVSGLPPLAGVAGNLRRLRQNDDRRKGHQA